MNILLNLLYYRLHRVLFIDLTEYLNIAQLITTSTSILHGSKKYTDANTCTFNYTTEKLN